MPAQLKGINSALPGSYGMNTQNEIATEQTVRFVSDAANGIVDGSGKLVSREDFVLQTVGYSDILDVLYNHRKTDGTEILMSAGAGVVYSGTSALTSRFDYSAGSQIVDVGGAKVGATATGLVNGADTYGMTVAVDGGAAQQITVTGSAAQTYTTLLAEINIDLAGATCALVGGNLKITSDTTGASSSIAIVNTAGTASNALLTTLTNFVAVRTASAGTIANDNWQFASLTGKVFMAQKGQAAAALNETTFAVESFIGQPWTSSPNVVLAADGRLWFADDETGGNRYTLWWSKLLDGLTLNSGDAGNLDVRNVWPEGQDSIIAVAFLSGRLVIFGRNNILLYTLPADHDPADMSLTDAISGIGCDARDSVVLANGDLYFKSDAGYYKIPKLAQVTSLLGIVKASMLVADDFTTSFASEDLAAVRAGYSADNSIITLTAPVANKTWVFHVDRIVPATDVDKVPAVTYWTNSAVAFRAFCHDKSGNYYCAMRNGIGKYTGYTPDGTSNAYSFDIYSLWDAMQDETRLKIMKALAITAETDIGQVFTLRWQFDYKAGTTRTASVTAGAVDFAEAPGIGVIRSPIGGTGSVIRYGFTTPINGDKVSYHSLRVFASPGATKIR